MGSLAVKFWNLLSKVRRPRCDGAEIMILLPSCLQNSECIRKITHSIDECENCGKCKVGPIIELTEKYGCTAAVATGGRLAMKLSMQGHIRAIVAVACEKELKEGLKGVFPKPALGVVNLRPNGPCKDTDVPLDEVEQAILYFTRDKRGEHK